MQDMHDTCYWYLVDDDLDDVELIQDAVQTLGLSIIIHHCKDGDCFFEDMTTNSLPHVIILDVNLPKENGFDILSKINNQPQFKNIPVIMISNTTGNLAERESRNMGAVYFLVKPNRFEDYFPLVEKIYSLCSVHQHHEKYING